MSAEIRHGDCRDVMAAMDPESVDAIVCDPPYGLAFMGEGWDHAVPGVEFWTAALRVAKPGTHLVAFGGTRTFHRLAVAIEDAGWEIRDTLSWLYGSGFPKSLDVGKAIDKAAGAERTEFAPNQYAARRPNGVRKGTAFADDNYEWRTPVDSAPATDAARQWDGWGTALKPAWEPVILARKPLTGTVAATVQAHGTGALNIAGCRIGTTDDLNGGAYAKNGAERHDGAENWRYRRDGAAGEYQQPAGRWPANVCLDEEAARLLDAQSGALVTGGGRRNGPKAAGTFGAYAGDEARREFAANTGGASRFFYTAKASRAERNAGLAAHGLTGTHPTVKPVALMRWLCRLVTPPGGLVLDPFCGSGSTGVAALAERFRFLGIEQAEEYVAIARARLAHAAEQTSLEVAA